MRERMSPSCLALTALVSGDEKCASGMVEGSRCGFMNSVARGTAIWACMSMVVDFGRISRPGRPCLRAAVSAYLFQTFDISLPLWSITPGLCRASRLLFFQDMDDPVKPGLTD